MKTLASNSIRCGDRNCGHQPLIRSVADQTSFQRKKYYNGIGSEKDIAWLKRLETGAFGSGFSDQIREVYKVRLGSPIHARSR